MVERICPWRKLTKRRQLENLQPAKNSQDVPKENQTGEKEMMIRPLEKRKVQWRCRCDKCSTLFLRRCQRLRNEIVICDDCLPWKKKRVKK
jgi:formylmethanofuran dehydrogenase subunit E